MKYLFVIFSVSIKRSHETVTNNSQDQERDKVELWCSKRIKMSKSFGRDFLTYLLENEPQSFKEKMSTPEASL